MILLLKAAVKGGALGDLFAVSVAVKGHTTAGGTYVAPYQAVRHKAPAAAGPAPRKPDKAWADAALAKEAAVWKPRVMQGARPMFRSVSPAALQDLVAKGAVHGKGNTFSDDRRHVFFGDALTPSIIRQGEELDRQAHVALMGTPLEASFDAADKAERDARDALRAYDAKPGKRDWRERGKIADSLNDAQAAARKARDDWRAASNAWIVARRKAIAGAPYTSAILETHPLDGGLHYSAAHGMSGMSGDEFGFPDGFVRGADVARVHLVSGGQIVRTAGLEELTAEMAPAPPAATPSVVSYNSGASSPAHLRGYIVAGSPVGVSLSEFNPGSATWDMVVGYAQRGGQVFVDSGAFPAFTRGEPVDWARNMALVQRLTEEARGARLHIVMPDLIGDQEGSLDLLSDHADYVRGVIGAGHDALVAIQKGPLSPRMAWNEAVHILGTDDFTVCVPSNKAAFSIGDLEDLMGGRDKPARVHFLGVAGNLRKLAELAAVVHRANPSCIVTSDANRIRAKVGQGRPMTEAAKVAQVQLRDAFAHLLDDQPELQRLWLEQADQSLGTAATTMAVHATEMADRRQPDLFTGKPLRKAIP
ncbi:MAG TPA: hypothetical protein VGC15_11010 [Acetobacteraceae bacterium]